jgi:cell division septal protein FtsQ
VKRARRRAAPRWSIDPALGRRALRWVLSGVAAAVLVVVGLPWARGVAREHPYFAVHEVVVRHRGTLLPDEVRATAGVTVGTSIWDVDVEAVETRLLTHGWVRSAIVRRSLPNRVVIDVRAHRPVAILAVADEAPGLYYVAANGRIFTRVAPSDRPDLPLVTGLGRKDLGGGGAFGPRAVRRALALLRRAAAVPEVGAVSEVHVDREQGLTLMPMRAALPIELGWGTYDAKLARLAEVLPKWAGREAEMRNVSCVFPDEVIVRVQGRAGTRPAPRGGAKAAGAATGA